MPIDPPSRWGDLTPELQTFLRRLTDAVNRLEPTIAARGADLAAAQQTDLTLADVAAQLQQLQQQVNTLTPRAEESEESVIPGQPSLPPTPTPGGGTPGLGTIGAGSAAPTVALPNLYDIVAAYAAAHPAELAASCLDTGGNWAFMDGVVAALMAADSRVGYNGKRGDTSDPSEDAVSYYHGVLPATLGSPNVYVIDIIGGHCGPNPVPAWSNVTSPSAQGAYMPTR